MAAFGKEMLCSVFLMKLTPLVRKGFWTQLPEKPHYGIIMKMMWKQHVLLERHHIKTTANE